MADILELIKQKLFLVGCILMMLAGAFYIIIFGDDFSIILAIPMIILGLLVFISGFITPVVSESKNGKAMGLILTLGALLGIIGVLIANENTYDIAFPMVIAGPVITFLIVLAWPCICYQGSTGIRSQIIGVASAHERMSMVELSNITGASVKLTSEIVYDAIGKKQLSGHMEGGTFIRAAPSTSTYSAPTTTTREREVVKVLVICPYCGAKTEQGLSKCQNCQADL